MAITPSTLWDQRQKWDEEDRDIQITNTVQNHITYINEGSFAEKPSPPENTDKNKPEDKGPSFKK
jgi:hypothetical protein